MNPVLGSVIKDARTRAGISQRQLAIRSGTSQSAISRIEAGLEEPSFDRFTRVLAGMGWKPDITLVPIADHGVNPGALAAMARLTPQERVDLALDLMRQGREKDLADRAALTEVER